VCLVFRLTSRGWLRWKVNKYQYYTMGMRLKDFMILVDVVVVVLLFVGFDFDLLYVLCGYLIISAAFSRAFPVSEMVAKLPPFVFVQPFRQNYPNGLRSYVPAKLPECYHQTN